MNRPCKELKRIARQNLSGRYGIPMAALLITGCIPMVAELPFSMQQSTTQPLSQTIIFYVADFLISLVAVVLSAGLTRLHLSVARGQQYNLKMVFYGFKNHPDRFILAGFLLFLIELIAMAPILAGITAIDVSSKLNLYKIIILVVLSIISLALTLLFQLWYGLTLYLLLDDPQISAVHALKLSRSMMKGHNGRLFYIYLSFLGMQFLNLLTFGIGSLWVMPYQTQTITNFYLEVRGELPPYKPDEIKNSPNNESIKR